MQKELSIIIPCYNCSSTLADAILSVYKQKLKVTFEIILVDDKSTDNTKEIIIKLSKEYSEIKYIFHNENMGGGASRNTGVRKSHGKILFFLDSDDILPEKTLSKMYNFLLEKKCDGVGMHQSIKFKGKNINNISHVNTFGYLGEKIPPKSLFEKKEGPFCPLYSVFMITKRAYDITGGYPENHGFDTQGFAFRFLINGLIAYTCPETKYLHRINFHKSYYVREYEQGRINQNWFHIFEEFLYIFNEEAQKFILSFNILDSNKNLMDELKNQGNILSNNFDKEIIHHSPEIKMEILEKSKRTISTFELYWMASVYMKKGRYKLAIETLKKLEKDNIFLTHVKEKTKICEYCLSGKSIKEAMVVIEKNKNYIKQGSLSPLAQRIFKKIKKKIKNNKIAFKFVVFFYGLKNNLTQFIPSCREKKEYYEKINTIKQKREIIFDIEFGGLGDWLAFSSLPRLLKEQYNINFYLSKQSFEKLRNKDTFRLCFEMNPYSKGIIESDKVFKFKNFICEKSLLNFFTDLGGKNITETIEKQFKLKGEGRPKFFYQPNTLPQYKNKILIDKNYISGKKLGWLYNEESFTREAKKHLSTNITIELIDPSKQNLFTYIDMIYSCHHFITVLSGGAALAAGLNKTSTAILPCNIFGGSVDQFIFKNSPLIYTK